MDRRQFIGALGAGLLLPLGGRSYALSGSAPHRFLFIHCTGGWDHLMVFTPRFEADLVMRSEQELRGVASEVGGLPFVDHPDREEVRGFLDAYSGHTAFLHGMEVRSVAHDVCLRLLLTGTSRPGAADWGSRLAADSTVTAPMVVVSGPSFAGPHGPSVVRLGENGQLISLVDGSWQSQATPATEVGSTQVQALEDAFAQSRSQAFAAQAPRGQGAQFGQDVLSAQQRVGELSALTALDLHEGAMLSDTAERVLDLFAADQATCAAVEYTGTGGLGFDTHAGNDLQSVHFNSLFTELNTICRSLETRQDSNGAPLMDTTTIVVFSEMGRHPKLNSRGGREHWTYTPAMLIGAGVRGGANVGGYDGALQGEPIDLDSGLPAEGGTALDPRHLGATLMAIADQDPGQAGVPHIPALLA